jgi:hypothetical protein
MNGQIVYSAQNIFGGFVANMLLTRCSEKDPNQAEVLLELRDTVDDYIEQA